MPSPLTVRVVVDVAAFTAAANALRQVDKKLPGRMRLLLRRIAQPIMREQRKLIRRMPVKGTSGTTGLRKEIARGVRLRLRTGKSPIMRIMTSIVRKKGGILPRGLDTFFPDFRGGPKNNFHMQNGYGTSWFMGPPADAQRDAENQVRKVLSMTATEIANATANASRGRPKK
jgi:hypothetical protein